MFILSTCGSEIDNEVTQYLEKYSGVHFSLDVTRVEFIILVDSVALVIAVVIIVVV